MSFFTNDEVNTHMKDSHKDNYIITMEKKTQGVGVTSTQAN